jgi:hypothetical protein
VKNIGGFTSEIIKLLYNMQNFIILPFIILDIYSCLYSMRNPPTSHIEKNIFGRG